MFPSLIGIKVYDIQSKKVRFESLSDLCLADAGAWEGREN